MKKKIIKICLIFSTLILMLSCGFEPLNKTINLDKIVISKKVFSGNSQINKKIFNKLSLKESNNVSDFVLKMHSENKIKILAKNTEGDATSYKTSLSIKVSLIKNNKIIDSLDLARSKFPGSSNSLDALCKRFNIDLTRRSKHNAILDCELLREVYINLLDVKEPKLSFSSSAEKKLVKNQE